MFSHAAPAVAANRRRNSAGGGWARRRRWQPARDAAWALLDRHVRSGDAVAVVGAGNGDDLPLWRLSRRAARLDLIDIDPDALRRAARRLRLMRRPPAGTLTEDVTGGAADALVARAAGSAAPVALPAPTPVGHGSYDVVVADLLATQLLYPSLLEAGLEESAIDAITSTAGQPLTEAVVKRLHASAPRGLVVHLHDLLGWWEGHPQPFAIGAVLALADRDPEAALALAGNGNLPYGCDPRAASLTAGADIVDTALWRWPFGPGTDYLVCATVARARARGGG